MRKIQFVTRCQQSNKDYVRHVNLQFIYTTKKNSNEDKSTETMRKFRFEFFFNFRNFIKFNSNKLAGVQN